MLGPLMPIVVGLLVFLAVGAAGAWLLSARAPKGFLARQEEILGMGEDQELVKRSFLENLEWDLRQAEIGPFWTPVRYLVASAVLGLVLWFVLSIVLGMAIFGLLGGAIGTLAVPRAYLDRQKMRRREATNRHVLDSQMAIANNIRAGRSVPEAFAEYANRVQTNRVAEELRRVVIDQQLGISFNNALWTAASRLGNQHFDRLATAIIQFRDKSRAELADILMQQAEYLRNHMLDVQEERAILGGPIGNYRIMGGILFMIVIITIVMNPEIFLAFYVSAAGQIVVVVMGSWWWVGYWLQSRQLKGAES